MSWASRRKTYYTFGVIAFLILVIGVPAFLFLYDRPTCTDGIQNGDERGIDCGGSCEAICVQDVDQPQILWSRSFRVTDGVYNAVAYIENPNFGAIARDVPYSFKLFDDENILIFERTGITTLSIDGATPIFEAAIPTGNRVPVRTFFEFSAVPAWDQRTEEDQLRVENIVLMGEETSPRIEARLVNDSVDERLDVEVVATIFNIEGNAIASSRTRIPSIDGRSERSVVFTWPQPFSEASAQIDLIPRVLR